MLPVRKVWDQCGQVNHKCQAIIQKRWFIMLIQRRNWILLKNNGMLRFKQIWQNTPEMNSIRNRESLNRLKLFNLSSLNKQNIENKLKQWNLKTIETISCPREQVLVMFTMSTMIRENKWKHNSNKLVLKNQRNWLICTKEALMIGNLDLD